jgi:hypothetical protein
VLIAFVAGVLLLIGGAAVANLLFRATRSSFADAIPANSIMFLHVDLLNVVLSDELGQIVDAFDAELSPGEEGFDAEFELDKLFLEEGYRFDFTNDIVPWVGRGVAVGVLDFEGRSGVPEFVVAVDVRDRSEFNAFWPKLMRTIEAESGEPVVESQHRGVTIHSALEASLAFTQDTLIVGPDARSVRMSIEALQSESLADNPAFVETMDELPPGRMVTAWFQTDGYSDLIETSAYSPEELEIYERFLDGGEFPSAFGFSADLGDPGVRMDFVTVYPQTSSLFNAMAGFEPELAAMAPVDTIGFVVAPPFVEIYLDQFADFIDRELQGPRDEFRQEYGIDMFDDLIRLLDGSFGMVVSENDKGWFERDFGVAIDGAVFIGTSDPGRLRDNLEVVVDKSGEPSISGPSGDPLLWDVQQGAGSWVFGADYGNLMAATDRSLVEELFKPGGGLKLSQDPKYREAAAELGSPIWLYVDITRILDLLPSEEVPERARILDYTAVGQTVDGSTVRATWVLSLDL